MNCISELEKDKFNSEIFKIPMGNLVIERCDQGQELDACISLALKKGKEEGFKHITCKVPTNDIESVNALERAGFFLVDTALTYTFVIGKHSLKNMNYECVLDDCKENDLDRLKTIAKESYKIDRFHSDKTLPNELCDKYYEKWVENSYYGFADKTLVAYYNGLPVGFETGKRRKGTPYYDLVLSAVDKNARGLGIYTSMIHYMTQHVIDLSKRDESLKAILLETQVDNIPVLKAWINLGYTAESSLYVMHKHM